MAESSKVRRQLQTRREQIQGLDCSDEAIQSILLFLDAYDPNVLTIEPPLDEGRGRRENTLADSSLLAYASTLKRTAMWVDLLDVTARELNQVADGRIRGTHESVNGDGLSQNTIHQNQIAWRSWAQFHENHPRGHSLTLDADNIVLVDRDETTVDKRDMFDPEEIQSMRDACRNKRDRAFLELLIFTGQRHNALRNLKIRDVEPERGASGVIHIPDKQGMKGAEGQRKPMLGAQKAVQEWLRAHPTGDGDDYFLTHIYEWSGHDSIEQGDRLSRDALGRITKRLADRADINKPANPHQFRHYFATQMISKHDMTMDHVRGLLGHAPGSRELERTYQHLVDDDYIESAEVATGIQEEHEESLTPATCFTCNEPLQPSWSACPNCGRVYGPGANDVHEEVEQVKTEAGLKTMDSEERAAVQTIVERLDDDAINQLRAAIDRSDVNSIEDSPL